MGFSDMYKYYSIIRYSHIIKVLNEITFPYAIVKGEPLSYFAYGSLGKRISSDIDILVAKENVRELEQILRKFGFVSKVLSREEQVLIRSFSHQLSPYVKKIELGTLFVDVNYDLFWGEYSGKRMDIKHILLDSICIDIYGYSVKTLPIFSTFVHLILHHYKEMNSIYHLAKHNPICHSNFQDVYNLLINHANEISIELLREICDEYKIFEYFYYVLYYTYQVTLDPFLLNYISAVETDYGKYLLKCYGLNEKERKEWKIDFQTRLASNSIFDFIKDDLSEDDLQKTVRQVQLFG